MIAPTLPLPHSRPMRYGRDERKVKANNVPIALDGQSASPE
jgi:hypothetical protein